MSKPSTRPASDKHPSRREPLGCASWLPLDGIGGPVRHSLPDRIGPARPKRQGQAGGGSIVRSVVNAFAGWHAQVGLVRGCLVE